jgi:hypothetical protein
MREVTFRDFQKLMSKRRRTVNDLVDIFRGKLEDSRSFFERVMACQWRNPETGRYEDRSDVMIHLSKRHRVLPERANLP